MPREEFIYRLMFLAPGQGGEEHYFTSLAAIYGRFTPEQVGCRVERLYAVGVSRGIVYRNRLVEIRRYPIARKQRQRRTAAE